MRFEVPPISPKGTSDDTGIFFEIESAAVLESLERGAAAGTTDSPTGGVGFEASEGAGSGTDFFFTVEDAPLVEPLRSEAP